MRTHDLVCGRRRSGVTEFVPRVRLRISPIRCAMAIRSSCSRSPHNLVKSCVRRHAPRVRLMATAFKLCSATMQSEPRRPRLLSSAKFDRPVAALPPLWRTIVGRPRRPPASATPLRRRSDRATGHCYPLRPKLTRQSILAFGHKCGTTSIRQVKRVRHPRATSVRRRWQSNGQRLLRLQFDPRGTSPGVYSGGTGSRLPAA